MEIIISEKDSMNIYENFIKKAFMVILNRRLLNSCNSLNLIDSQVKILFNIQFFSNEEIPIDFDIEKIFKKENELNKKEKEKEKNNNYSLLIFITKLGQKILIEKWDFVVLE